MKKALFILLSYLLFINPVFAIETINAPSWDEFCPSQFYNAEYLTPPKKRPVLELVSKLSIIGLPYAWYIDYKRIEATEYNNAILYWKKREKIFNDMISNCNALDINNRVVCYMQVRQIEQQKNNQLKNEEIARNQAILNTFNSMLLGNQLDAINNSIRMNQYQYMMRY